MDEILEVTEQPTEETTEEIVRHFATIGAVYEDGVSLIFDGEDAPTEKHYLCNTNVYFSPGDRVRILEDSGTYIVEYVVGSPKQRETVGIPEGGTTGQALRKTSGENYAASWQNVNEVPTSGKTGYLLTKTADGYSWQAINVREVPSGGTTGQTIRKTATGYDWTDANEVPTTGTTGYVLTKTAKGYSWQAVPTEIPSTGTTGYVLTKTASGFAWQALPSEGDISLLKNGSNTVGLTSATLFTPSVTSSTSSGISIGSSSYWFKDLYIGGNYGSVHLCQSTSNSKLSFFGATAQSRLTLSTTSANQGYTSATSSNYLNIINNIAGILKKYGLIG